VPTKKLPEPKPERGPEVDVVALLKASRAHACTLALLRAGRQARPVYGLSTSLMAALLSFAPPAESKAKSKPSEKADLDLSAEQCRDRDLDLFVGYGSAAAPKLLRVYIDAIEPNQLQLWLEARRIVGERSTELRLELIPTRGGRADPDPSADAVRLWFVTAAAIGAAEPALRLLDGQDWQRISAQVATVEGRATLARELGVEPALFEDRHGGASGSCLARGFERSATELAVHTMGQLQTVVGIVGADGVEQINHTDPTLSELRTAIDRFGIATAPVDNIGTNFVPFAPAIGGQSSRLDRTFPGTGVLVGGEALPHRLVIFVEDEEHGRLPDWLAPAMRFRAQHPGEMSIQVVAAGVGTRAITLRRRLCAARTLGLEVEYLLHLAEQAPVRRLHEESLNATLEPVAVSDSCSDREPLEPDKPNEDGTPSRESDFGHPRGAWLDGRPVNPPDLDNLEWQLETTPELSIIDWLTTPELLGDETERFEFEF
jgi:hypothetical protein